MVVGAGPAGSVLAARLSAAGLKTLVVEKTRFDLDRVGEFLSPKARVAVDRLGLLPSAWKSQYVEISEFISCWGSPRSNFRNYIYDPYGHGLVLDRTHFNRSLAATAQRMGAKLLTAAALVSATRSFDGWTIAIRQMGAIRQFNCSFLVLAGGRQGVRLRSLQTNREHIDKLVCFVLRIKNFAGDGIPAIESYAHGWAYSVKLPCGDLMINLCTESASRPKRLSKSLRFLFEEVGACPIARSRLLGTDPKRADDVEAFVTDASSARTRPVAGPGWCLAGDCAQSMDPLSSSGIVHAIQHAELAAKEIIQSAALKDLELSAYSSELDKIHSGYLSERGQVYGAEQRWDTPFWQRRSARGAQPTPAGSAPPQPR